MFNVVATTPSNASSLLQRLGTALVGSLFLISGIVKIVRFDAVAPALAGKGIPFPEFALALVILVEVVCGAALIASPSRRAAAAVLAVFVVAATVLFHAFWKADAISFQNQLNHFLKNVAILGALLSVAFQGPARKT